MPAIIHHRVINYFFLYFDELQKINFMDLNDSYTFFYVLLTVHLSIILVINQLDAQNLVL